MPPEAVREKRLSVDVSGFKHGQVAPMAARSSVELDYIEHGEPEVLPCTARAQPAAFSLLELVIGVVRPIPTDCFDATWLFSDLHAGRLHTLGDPTDLHAPSHGYREVVSDMKLMAGWMGPTVVNLGIRQAWKWGGKSNQARFHQPNDVSARIGSPVNWLIYSRWIIQVGRYQKCAAKDSSVRGESNANRQRIGRRAFKTRISQARDPISERLCSTLHRSHLCSCPPTLSIFPLPPYLSRPYIILLSSNPKYSIPP